VAVRKEAVLFDSQGEQVYEPVYELEDSGVRLKPINPSVFWCDETSEVYRRVRVPIDN